MPLTAAAVAVSFLPTTGTRAADDKLTPAEAKATGKGASLWGMRPVAIYHLRYNRGQNEKSPAYVGINRLRWYRKPITAADRSAATPHATTLHGLALLALSKGPVGLTVPDIKGHYWSTQFADNYARWRPLMVGSQFNAPGPPFTKQGDGYAGRTAFQRFERLGLKAGQAFDPDKLPAAIRTAVAEGIDEARAEATKAFRAPGQEMNGWRLSTDLGYRDTNWAVRAGAGLYAVRGPVPSRARPAALGLNGANGRPPSGEHRYAITFGLKDLPPATAFWETPLYDHDGHFVDNPINRYSLNSYMLKRGQLHTEGGKLVICVQADEPKDANRKENWLPAPKKGGPQFAARFYGPNAPLLDGSYNMPGAVPVA
jgi:hypothetical protein